MGSTSFVVSVRVFMHRPACLSCAVRIPRTAVLVLLAALAAAGPMAMPAGAVSTADEICAPEADPCVIGATTATKYVVDNGAVLDFGLREVRVEGNNSLDFGAGSATLRCGRLLVSAGDSQIPFVVRGTDNFGDVSGGFLTIEARRACSLNTDRPCLTATDCDLGTCDARSCTDNAARGCDENSDCQLGFCQPNGRCNGASTFRCTSNADCDLGTCGEQTFCNLRPTEACASNADCEFGECSVGDSYIDFDGRLNGHGVDAGVILLRAAGDIYLKKPWKLNGTTGDSDGGEIDATSNFGAVVVTGAMDLTAGRFSEGGSVDLQAANFVITEGEIDASGGDFDGGTVDMTAGNDINVRGNVLCGALAGEGEGGSIALDAGRNLFVGAASGTTRLELGGHEADGFGGSGGTAEFYAGAELSFEPTLRLFGNGATPDGSGSEVLIDGDGPVFLDGTLQARSSGNQGFGGFVDVSAKGDLTMAATTSIDVTGGESAGAVEMRVSGDTILDGTIDARSIVVGGSPGSAGYLLLASGGNVDVQGLVQVQGDAFGGDGGLVELAGCDVALRSGAEIDNAAVQPDGGTRGGLNRLKAGEHMSIEAGATLRADGSGGANQLRYRDAGDPPSVTGTVIPTASLVVDETIAACPRCGNGELEDGELCDDGNLSGGDGCSADCILEGCIDATPGYPTLELCDDEDPCTVDSCDVEAETCVHVALCDDGVDCTEDTCANGNCTFTPDHAACDDANECTDDICSAVTGCGYVDNTAACEDGAFCTDGDFCMEGECVGGSARDCGDGVSCTADSCDEELDLCRNSPDHAACSDGVFCNGPEICDSINDCQPSLGPADCSDLDSECSQGRCDEVQDQCVVDAINEAGACDDADDCTADDTCTGGLCQGTLQGGCGCGDAVIQNVEECDDGATVNSDASGAFCSTVCESTPCGAPVSKGVNPVATDALFVLRSAVGADQCDLRVCDVDSGGSTNATDALLVLRKAVNQPVVLNCT